MQALETNFVGGTERHNWLKVLPKALHSMRSLPRADGRESPYDMIFKVPKTLIVEAEGNQFFVYRPEMKYGERTIGPCEVLQKGLHEWSLRSPDGAIIRAARARIMEAGTQLEEEVEAEETAEDKDGQGDTVIHPIYNIASVKEIEEGCFEKSTEKDLANWERYDVATEQSTRTQNNKFKSPFQIHT
eukprot:Platyproteum_vivax@DN5832_c0_g1_i1.p1